MEMEEGREGERRVEYNLLHITLCFFLYLKYLGPEVIASSSHYLEVIRSSSLGNIHHVIHSHVQWDEQNPSTTYEKYVEE